MPEQPSTVQALAALLREAQAAPRVNPERVVRSTLYDLEYHVALIACVFFQAADEGPVNMRSVVAHWLKILQFVAVRPSLLSDFVHWARARRAPTLETWQKMPRGYIGDTTHDRTVELLIAMGVIRRRGDKLESAEHFGFLRSTYDRIVAQDLLRSERATLSVLAEETANRTLLAGR